MFILAGISLAALAVAGIFLYQAFASPLSYSGRQGWSSSDPGKTYLSAAEAAAATSEEEPPMLEVHIANNGLVLLRGAHVISRSGSLIRVKMAWGSSDFVWAIQTGPGTKFFTAEGEKGALMDISIGDSITATGKIVRSGNEPMIDAEFVRE